MEMGSWDSPLMISDDDEEPAPAGAEQPEEPNLEVPDWVPDGWTVEACRLDDGIINWYYTCPVTDFTFTMKSEVMQYIHSGAAEHALQAKATLDDETTLQGKYSWLPLGWMIEIRAGGDDMQKMFKFFVHESSGVRLSSKEDVLLYENEGKISKCSTNEECDTSSKDNMIAQLEFNIKGLPAGWVKETTFRKCNNGMRKDPYFTDPVNHYVFRTWESAEIYFSTGEIISSNVYFERKSVTKKYSFDKCTNMYKLHKS